MHITKQHILKSTSYISLEILKKFLSSSKMQNQPSQPPPGYPTGADQGSGKKKKCLPQTKAKGERGFIEGCLFALCCCWICEVCFD